IDKHLSNEILPLEGDLPLRIGVHYIPFATFSPQKSSIILQKKTKKEDEWIHLSSPSYFIFFHNTLLL
ncbi:MAG: hypothetical protein WCF60_20285, partial [Anaerobacillus sp.]